MTVIESDDFQGLYGEAIRLWEKLAGLKPKDVHIRLSLSLDYDRLALLEGVSGNLEGALEKYRKSASHLQQVVVENPSPEFQSLLSLGNLRIANALAALRRNDEALSQYDLSVNGYRRLSASALRNVQLNHGLVTSYLKRAECFLRMGDYEHADTDFRSSLQVISDSAIEDLSTQRDRAAIVEGIAHLALLRGDLGEALRSYNGLVAFYKKMTIQSLANGNNRQYNAEDLPFVVPVSQQLFESSFRNWSWWAGEVGWINPALQINSSKEPSPAIGKVGKYILSIVVLDKRASVDRFDIQSQRSLARCYAGAGDVEILLGHLGEARGAIQHSLTIREQLAAVYPNSALFATDLAASLELGGDLDKAAGDSESARLKYRRALELAKRLAVERGDSEVLLRVARLLVKVVALESSTVADVGQGLSNGELRQIAINMIPLRKLSRVV